MANSRKCERCSTGTETCVIGDFYVCDLCDSSDSEHVYKSNWPLLTWDEDDDTEELVFTWDI